MKNKIWKNYALWIAVTEITGAVSAVLTKDGIKNYAETAAKPMLSPPSLAFPIVWSILFALMGIGAAMIYIAEDSGERKTSLSLYGIQLGVNFFWSIIFFNYRCYGFALLWLVGLLWLIIWMTISFYKVRKTAAFLQIPYIVWVSFAAYLNAGTWLLN